MDIPAIFASLRRSSMGAVLIILQVALTLAILLNSAGIVREHVRRMHSSSGVDETTVFSLTNRWIGSPGESVARVDRDLAVMRAVPGVVAAVSTNGVPLSRRGWGVRISQQPVDPARQGDLTRSQLYYLDHQGLDALGLRLTAGRWFTAEDIASAAKQEGSGVAVLTRALADHLFPDGKALGKAVYTAYSPLTVVGIVEKLQISDPGQPSIPIENTQYSVMIPMRMAQPVVNAYIVRARPGSVAAVMQEVEKRLRAADPMRVITNFETFTETRHNTYRGNRTLTAVLVAVSSLLVLVTALGIAGLASYWVAQRQRMIGVRRALGARRADILAYFHSENLLIVGAGVLLGLGLAIALNTLLVKSGVPRLDKEWLIGGVLGVLCIGQLAVLQPALRAARVPPALAVRSG
jgi:putative ABC transport system permease protein